MNVRQLEHLEECTMIVTAESGKQDPYLYTSTGIGIQRINARQADLEGAVRYKVTTYPTCITAMLINK